ncbi:MAG: glycosyl hydrolase [Bacteroidetes bacterium]|nr:glycosyl hydrolase [Bacteroidota bacterium]
MKRQILLPVLFLVSTCIQAQTKINSATFGVMEARQLGPGTMSGRITAIEGVISDNKTIYTGTAGGGIWKSTNAGASWKPIFDKYCQSIGALAIDQTKPDIVFAGTGESNMRNSVSIGNGLYKSTDGGENWSKLGLDSTEHISKIVINPKNSDIVYVAAPGPLWCDSKHRGLYKTTDGGKTWNKILYINEKSGCADIALDPQNPETIYATTWEFRRLPYSFNSGGKGSGFYKSTDGGRSWKELKNGLPQKPFGRVAIALAPSNPKKLLAIVEAKETGLYISEDAGETWKSQSSTMNVTARPFYFSTIVFDPKDANRVYRPAFSFSYSNDGGYSFSEASNEGGWVHSDHHALWINPNYTNQMFLGTDGGVYFSMDRGATWLFVQNLPVGQFYHVAIDNQQPYRMYGGLQDNGSWIAPSAAPGGIGNANWMNIYFGDGFWTQPDLNDPNIAYAEYQGGNMGRINLTTLKSVNIQPQQTPKEEKLRWNWNTPITMGTANTKNLYTGAQYLYRTTDQGRSWERISPDLTTNDKKKLQQEESGGLSADNTSAENHCTIFTITESPFDEKTIWVGTDDGNLQLTTDAGKTWTNVAKNYATAGIPPQTWVSSIELSKFDKNTVYATFDNHMYGDMKTYLAKSTDLGKTWQLINSIEFTGFAHKIKEDFKNKNLLFLGTENGLFASVNGGTDWFRMKSNIPEYAMVRDIQIHPTTNDLVLATHGRGIIVLDDITPIRELTQSIADSAIYIFPSKPMTLSMGKYGSGGFPGNGGWTASNPSYTYTQPIQYYFKERLNTGDVKLNIYDEQGKLIQQVPGTKRKGINMVYWNMRYTPPKVATGGSKPDYSGFIAPMVMPGKYTVKITIGNKEYASNLTLIPDNSDTSYRLTDRKAQHDAAMKLYQLHENLYQLTTKINNNQKMLKANDTLMKTVKGKKLLQDYNAALESLRSTLLATKSKSIFADESKLREQISELYRTLCAQEARPTELQTTRIAQLQGEFEKAQKQYEIIDAKYAEQSQIALEAEKKIGKGSGSRSSH